MSQENEQAITDFLDTLRGLILSGEHIVIDRLHVKALMDFNIYTSMTIFKEVYDNVKYETTMFSNWLESSGIITILDDVKEVKPDNISVFNLSPICPEYRDITKTVLILTVTLGNDIALISQEDVYYYAVGLSCLPSLPYSEELKPIENTKVAISIIKNIFEKVHPLFIGKTLEQSKLVRFRDKYSAFARTSDFAILRPFIAKD